jgi:hypothetical protein
VSRIRNIGQIGCGFPHAVACLYASALLALTAVMRPLKQQPPVGTDLQSLLPLHATNSAGAPPLESP